ncbi:type VI secretion system baseplate subunit TssG [Dyella sp. 333MFSha]|uniref:type VI secretion system baseplate subunit TssG n=1 Tax=Dyella sp. 333MFSha TaxID=1798240 RepID=UPI0008801A86|nr:type VI secretion system baseplate subunit TssG [Dyella sp. 333MFSha]SDG77767.1 type VI secretion system protein ImpH [Dyella sp. 333MFSha]
MDGSLRHAPDPLTLFEALRGDPSSFDWFEALRRVECVHADRPRLGRSVRPADDPVRLAHTPSLDFAPRSIDRVEIAAGRPPRIHSLMLGLWGPNGALPLHLTEYTLERERVARDGTFTAFADVFHHRMLSLFYRAWADAQPTVQMDRPDEDAFAHFLGALVGIDSPALAGRDALPDRFKRYMAGRVLSQARNAEGLTAFLGAFFEVPVHVEEFAVAWLTLPDEGRLRMGVAMAGMGTTAVLGERVRDAQHRVRLRLGPMRFADYRRFLPGGDALDELIAALRFYAGDAVDWDAQLVLRREEVPLTHMGRAGRLGMSSWMGRFAGPGDAGDLVVQPMTLPNRSRKPS